MTTLSKALCPRCEEKRKEGCTTSLVIHRANRSPFKIDIDRLPIEKEELGQLIYWFMKNSSPKK